MGVERSVTRWYVKRQVLLSEVGALEARLAQVQTSDQTEQAPVTEERAAVEAQLAVAHIRLQALGSCPRPMMG